MSYLTVLALLHRVLGGLHLRKQETLSSLKVVIDPADIRQRSRILLIDDEKPDLVDHLKSNGYAVDYEVDLKSGDTHRVLRYDLVILDFGNVGRDFGSSEGLDILRYLKRASPQTKVLAYTSKSLGSEMADFFRMADGILKKDAGLRESLERIDDMLIQTASLERHWGDFLVTLGISKGSYQDRSLQDQLVRSIKKQNEGRFSEFLGKYSSSDTAKATGKYIWDLTGRLLEAQLKSPHGHV